MYTKAVINNDNDHLSAHPLHVVVGLKKQMNLNGVASHMHTNMKDSQVLLILAYYLFG